MSASGSSKFTIEAFDVFAASAYVESERSLSLGKIDVAAAWKAGAGTADLEVAIGARIKFTGVTGNQTINLASFTSHLGAAQVIANLKAVYVLNEGTNALDIITVGGGTTPVALFGATTDTYKLQAGSVFPWEKKLGAGLATSGAANLQLAFGARTFSATVILLGY
jgi:hypothetical protein